MRSRATLPFILPISLVLLFACDRKAPLDPLQAADGALLARETAPPLEAPSNLMAAAASTTRIDISWQDNSSSESRFELFRSTSGESGAFTLLISKSADVITHADEGLSPGTRYCYKARAARVLGGRTVFSEFSSTACASTAAPPPPPPNPPDIWDAQPLDSITANVTWSDNSSNEDGFKVYRSIDGGVSWSLAGTATGTAFLDSGVPHAELSVCYHVTAFNAAGESTSTGSRCTSPPAAPTNLIVIQLDSQTVDLRWNDNSAVEDMYQVWAEWIFIPPCNSGSCDAGYYFYDYMVAELPANSTSYHCDSCGGDVEFWVVATKNGFGRRNR